VIGVDGMVCGVAGEVGEVVAQSECVLMYRWRG